MEPFKIFIVEDDPWYGEILEYHLSLNEDYIISRFTTGKECLANLHKKPDLITIDFSLPDYTGDKLYQRIREIDDSIPVLAISGQEEITVAVNLLKMGITDYIIKDENTKDMLWNAVINIRKMGRLKKEVEHLKEELGQKFAFEKKLIVKELMKYGILTLLTTLQRLTIDSLNKYLELKARQAL